MPRRETVSHIQEIKADLGDWILTVSHNQFDKKGKLLGATFGTLEKVEERKTTFKDSLVTRQDIYINGPWTLRPAITRGNVTIPIVEAKYSQLVRQADLLKGLYVGKPQIIEFLSSLDEYKSHCDWISQI